MLKKLNKSGFFSIILAISLYYTARMLKHSPSLPRLSDIFVSAIEILSSAKFYLNLAYTIKIVVLGVMIAFVCGTHNFAERQWAGSIQNGWQEVFEIEPEWVYRSAEYIESAREFLDGKTEKES